MSYTVYYRQPDGSVSSRSVAGAHAEPPPIPEDATEITADEYQAALEQIRAAHSEQDQRVAEQDRQRQEQDYQALVALGLPAETAQRLTGYVPDDRADD
ncbi:hypothetical protein [Thermomonospora cellulosilytica]|uniref:Uncharacterized protein n=1 Tax=Thermomonospora cellulosilytica TaxID=1411118 RepID=A0A7W3N1P2_9ACTN|nr:hypothetical protein [Thermomonospora cellulosilytica]MBA9005904.1 hypothetical protein [Thermomonospora cellulosilytica]